MSTDLFVSKDELIKSMKSSGSIFNSIFVHQSKVCFLFAILTNKNLKVVKYFWHSESVIWNLEKNFLRATFNMQEELSRLVLQVISPASSRWVSLNISFLFLPSTTISTRPSSGFIFFPSRYQETSASSASTSISNSHRSCSTTLWPFSWEVKVWGYSGNISEVIKIFQQTSIRILEIFESMNIPPSTSSQQSVWSFSPFLTNSVISTL